MSCRSPLLMIKKLITLSLILCITHIFSQNVNQELIEYIKNADTILLATHEDLRLDIEKPGKSTIIHRTLLKNNRPNPEIIKKQVILNFQSRQELTEILKGQKNDKHWDGAYCFEPHHALFIYNTGKWENIDLCFGCDQYNYSAKVPVNTKELLITYQDWRDLEMFFLKHDLNWENIKKESKKD